MSWFANLSYNFIMKHLNRSAYCLYSATVPLLIMALALGFTYYKYSTDRKEDASSVLSASSKKGGQSQKNSKSENSSGHKENVQKIVKSIEQVSDSIKTAGNKKVGTTLDEISTEIEEQVDDTSEVIEEVESLPKWQEFLVGTGFDNLGKLRSAISHYSNANRKLVREMGTLGPGETNEQLLQQVQMLNQEGERLHTILQEHEGQFSLLGWFSRFFNGGLDNDETSQVDEPIESSESTQAVTTD